MNFENLEQQRGQFEEENEIRAKERNKNRTLGEKLTLKNKATGLEITAEEAVKMDEEAEKLVQHGEASTLSEAIEKLNTKEEFALKGKELIQKEEYARARALKVVEKIEAGEFEKARQLLSRSSAMAVDYDEETQRLIGKYVAPFVRARIIEDIKNKNGDDLVKLLERLSTYSPNVREFIPFIKADDLREIPQDVLKSPEIFAKIQDYLVDSLRNTPNVFDRVLEKYIELGFVTKEEIVTLPKIEETAKSLLMHSPLQQEAYTDSPASQLQKLFRESTFGELKEIFILLGILSEAEIERIRSKI